MSLSKWAVTKPDVSTANGWRWTRMTVDILFFGSRRDGLWRSADRGATWQKVEGFPNVGSRETACGNDDSRPWFGFNQQPVGIVCVLFDPAGGRPGQPTPSVVCGGLHRGNQSLLQHRWRDHLAGGGESARGIAPQSPRSGPGWNAIISVTARNPARIP